VRRPGRKLALPRFNPPDNPNDPWLLGETPVQSVRDTDLGTLLFPNHDNVMAPLIDLHGTWEPEERAWLEKTLETNGGDYEPAYAVLNELARRSRDRFREYLIVANSSSQANGLLDAMTRISESGASSWHTRPLSELAGTADAVCVFLNHNPHPVAGCRRGDGIRLIAEGM
jgi:hypothetical protein